MSSRAVTRQEVLDEFARVLRGWSEQCPGEAGEIRQQVCAARGMTEAEYTAWVGTAGTAGSGFRVSGSGLNSNGGAPAALKSQGPLFPGQPAPIAPPGSGDGERGEISNHFREVRLVADKKLAATFDGKDLAELRALDRERLACKRALAEWMKGGKQGPEPEEMSAEKRARLDVLVDLLKAKPELVSARKEIGQMRSELRSVMRGWPMRLASGALFVDDGRADKPATPVKSDDGMMCEAPVLLVKTPSQFLSLLHDYGTVKFNRGQDADRSNYVDTQTLYENVCSSRETPLWREVERFPHEPVLPAHYYAWRPDEETEVSGSGFRVSGSTATATENGNGTEGARPARYVPTGETLAELLGFFDNIIQPHHRALFAAAVVTVFWGGPYGARPFFFFYASMQGSGKSTAAEVICLLVGGYAAINFDQRAEERLKERILSDDFAGTRCLLADNIIGRVESPLLAELATSSRISGKKLGVGEGWRPNSLCVYLTGNNPQLVKDLTSRTMFVKFEPIEEVGGGKDVGQRLDWKTRLRDFLREKAKRVMADCLAILAAPAPDIDWSGVTSERNADWVANVLARVMANEHVAGKIGAVRPQDVILRNQAYRDSVDDELDEATRFLQALLERVCEWHGFHLFGEGNNVTDCWPREAVFIRASPPEDAGGDDDGGGGGRIKRQNVATVWKSTIRGDVNPTWVGRRVNMHIESGRLPGLRQHRSATQRGYKLDAEAIVRFLAMRAGKDPDAVVEEWRNGAESDGHQPPPQPEGVTA